MTLFQHYQTTSVFIYMYSFQANALLFLLKLSKIVLCLKKKKIFAEINHIKASKCGNRYIVKFLLTTNFLSQNLKCLFDIFIRIDWNFIKD